MRARPRPVARAVSPWARAGPCAHGTECRGSLSSDGGDGEPRDRRDGREAPYIPQVYQVLVRGPGRVSSGPRDGKRGGRDGCKEPGPVHLVIYCSEPNPHRFSAVPSVLRDPSRDAKIFSSIAQPLLGCMQGHCMAHAGPLKFPNPLLGFARPYRVPGHYMAPDGLREIPGHECQPPLLESDGMQFQITA